MSIVQINALSVPEGMGHVLEQRFAARKKAVDQTPGFEGFDLLRPTDGIDKYLVVTRWESQEAFDNWRNGAAFQQGHAQAGSTEGKPGGHPGGDQAAEKKAHAEERRGDRQPAATDSELWGFEVVDLDALADQA